MVECDFETGEANVFFPSHFSDPKTNVLSRLSFDKTVSEAGMNNDHCPRYPIPNNVDPDLSGFQTQNLNWKTTYFFLQRRGVVVSAGNHGEPGSSPNYRGLILL